MYDLKVPRTVWDRAKQKCSETNYWNSMDWFNWNKEQQEVGIMWQELVARLLLEKCLECTWEYWDEWDIDTILWIIDVKTLIRTWKVWESYEWLIPMRQINRGVYPWYVHCSYNKVAEVFTLIWYISWKDMLERWFQWKKWDHLPPNLYLKDDTFIIAYKQMTPINNLDDLKQFRKALSS